MRFNKQKSGCGILGANRVVEASGLLSANAVIESPCENTTTTSTTTCALPEVPSGMEILEAAPELIELSWTSPEDFSGVFELWRKVDDGDYALYFITNLTEFMDLGINDFTEYCYKVRAKNTCGYSGFAEEVCSTNGVTTTTTSTSTTSTSTTSTTSTTTAATTTSTTSTSTSTTSTSTTSTSTTSTSTTTCGIPETPETPVVSDGPPEFDVEDVCSLTISWVIPSGADVIKLKLFQDGVPLALFTFSEGETSTSFGVQCGFEYCFEVQACNDCGCSEFSEQACTDCACTTTTTSTTTCALPETPANPSLTSLGDCLGRLMFTPVAGSTRTEIKILINGVEQEIVSVDYPVAFYDFETAEGETWCFFIRACNDCGCSGWTGGEEGICGYFCATTTTTTTAASDCGDLAAMGCPGSEFEGNYLLMTLLDSIISYDGEATFYGLNPSCQYWVKHESSETAECVTAESTEWTINGAAGTYSIYSCDLGCLPESESLEWLVTYNSEGSGYGGISVGTTYPLGTILGICPGETESSPELPSSASVNEQVDLNTVPRCDNVGTFIILLQAVPV